MRENVVCVSPAKVVHEFIVVVASVNCTPSSRGNAVAFSGVTRVGAYWLSSGSLSITFENGERDDGLIVKGGANGSGTGFHAGVPSPGGLPPKLHFEF